MYPYYFYISSPGWSWIFKVARNGKNKWGYERCSNWRSWSQNGYWGILEYKARFYRYGFISFIITSISILKKCKIAKAEAELQRMEAKLKNETGMAKAQRDFDIKKGKSKFLYSHKAYVLNSNTNTLNNLEISGKIYLKHIKFQRSTTSK